MSEATPLSNWALSLPVSGAPLPPGPSGLPVIGNLLDFPKVYPWLKFTTWAEQYGDIMYLDIAGQGILVLNTIDTVNALLVEKASNYSDRPTFTMIGDLMGLNQCLLLLPYGPTFKEQRKLCHIALNPNATRKHDRRQEDAVAMFLKSLIDAPDNFMKELKLTGSRIIMTVTYGIPLQAPDDVYITRAEEVVALVSKSTVPGAHVVDVAPWLRHLPSWLPWNTIHDTADYGRALIWSMITRPYEHVKREYAEGQARPSFVKDWLEFFSSEPSRLSSSEQDHLIRWSAGAMYGAGAESLYIISLNVFIAMALYPEVQCKLLHEIQQVIGCDRFPEVSDRPRLPLLNAAIKEALRWRPSAPLGVPHLSKENDFFRGYFIPKGTIVMPNVWRISNDADKTGIPTTDFAPERFLQGGLKESPADLDTYAFGFGKRVCPGKHLAETSAFILFASIISAFEISMPRGAGKRSPSDVAYTSGLTS
ncbi:cytochrome P450 [Hymenopellis radicata]|nr:cytochrome P450 [Hymenopellis radicata]